MTFPLPNGKGSHFPTLNRNEVLRTRLQGSHCEVEGRKQHAPIVGCNIHPLPPIVGPLQVVVTEFPESSLNNAHPLPPIVGPLQVVVTEFPESSLNNALPFTSAC